MCFYAILQGQDGRCFLCGHSIMLCYTKYKARALELITEESSYKIAVLPVILLGNL
jgi:hypothetical protein